MLYRKVLIIALAAVASFMLASHSLHQGGPQLSFDKERHDYGSFPVDSMPEGNWFYLDIPFTNTGNAPLLLTSVRACCGTHVQNYPQEPISPGESGTIKVRFRLHPRAQNISRSVTVQSNCSKRQTQVFRITGKVTQ